MSDLFDPTTYQFRSYFRVHLLHFIVSPLIGGTLIHIHNRIPFIDAWFSSLAAMTGGSLMPYDVSKLDRFGEFVLYVLMFVGGVTIMCVPPALNRIYIFRRRLSPALADAISLTQEVLVLAKEAGAEGADQLESDIQDFKDMQEEYQLKNEVQETIAMVAGIYTGCWHFFGAAGLYTTIQMRGTLNEYAARGISDAWFSIFMVRAQLRRRHCMRPDSPHFPLFQICSCLNNVGLSLLDDSMIPLSDRPAPLMIMAFAMILGNTAWPIALRGILIVLSRLFPDNRSVRHALDNPQQSSASLFSAAQTWGLVVAVVVSNVFMTFMFLVFSAHRVRDGRSWGAMFYLGFFQCTNARSSGLQVFDLKRLSKNMLVIIGFFMWYAPTPLVGIIGGEEFNMAFSDNPILSGFIKKYTNRHTTWIVVIYIVISTAEEHILTGADNFPPMTTPRTTLFNILFEMMSAYGTNGLSMGFPGVNHSLSGMFKPISKLCIMFLMIMGRHRSMQGKSDPTLMTSLARLTEHVEMLRAQREALLKPAELARHSRGVSQTNLELHALHGGENGGDRPSRSTSLLQLADLDAVKGPPSSAAAAHDAAPESLTVAQQRSERIE